MWSLQLGAYTLAVCKAVSRNGGTIRLRNLGTGEGQGERRDRWTGCWEMLIATMVRNCRVASLRHEMPVWPWH